MPANGSSVVSHDMSPAASEPTVCHPALEESSSFELLTGNHPEVVREQATRLARKWTEDIQRESEEQILQLSKEIAVLKAIAAIVVRPHSLEKILNDALEKIADMMEIESGGVYLCDKSTENLNIKVARDGADSIPRIVSPIKVGKGLAGRVARTGKPLFVESLRDASELIGRRASRMVAEEGISSVMCVPLKARGRILGVFYGLTRGDRTMTSEERNLLITVGHQLSSAIDTAQLLEDACRPHDLEDTDRAKMTSLATISHEMRTPLTSIKGCASSLLQPDVEWDPETRTDFLKIILQESDQLVRIVNDILDVSKMSMGSMTFEKKVSLFEEVINGIRGKLHSVAYKHDLKILQPEVSPLILMDQARVGQVIVNLVENAASYSPDGTEIAVEAAIHSGELIVTVSDRGVGIPRRSKEKIFDRFYRLEENGRRRRNGTGLGLAICKAIVEEHDGEIWVESKVGKGSKFSFSIPIVEEPDE